MKARINGVKSTMEKFEFLFAINLAAMLLAQSDNLAKSLQTKESALSKIANVNLVVCKSFSQAENLKI